MPTEWLLISALTRIIRNVSIARVRGGHRVDLHCATVIGLDQLVLSALDSDPHEVDRIAIETAKTIKRVSEHIPVCCMTAFSASSLDFKLRF